MNAKNSTAHELGLPVAAGAGGTWIFATAVLHRSNRRWANDQSMPAYNYAFAYHGHVLLANCTFLFSNTLLRVHAHKLASNLNVKIPP
jgi:hypothetical protein